MPPVRLPALHELRHERRICWANTHPERLRRGLHELEVALPSRAGWPHLEEAHGSVVAWSELQPDTPADAPGGRWRRRVWILCAHKPDEVRLVDALSITAGRGSREVGKAVA